MATLNENILKIKSTFDEIATAIEQKGVPVGECDSPTTYANKIRSIAGSGTGIEPYDFSAEVYELPDSAKEPVVNTTVTDSGEVIFTFGIRRGEKGVPGAKGEKGEQGPAGKDAVGIESTEVSYGINDSGVIEPSSWTPQIPHPDPGKYMWTKTTWTYTDGSSNTGKQVTYISKDGVNGQDGADGMDGSVYEYVYFRGITADDRPPKPTGGNSVDDFKPTYTKTVYVNGNPYVLEWLDKAQGVDETYKFEWQSERKKETTSTWGDFTEPILWAKYGEKGKDGDGVQYIFTTTDKQSAPDNPTPDNWETDPEYQNNESEEYIPKPVDGQVWKDDPIEVDDVNRYCWVSIRKYRNGKWGKYSDPTLWTKWVDSSGAVTGDVVVIDMDPDWVMLNEDENTVSTTITAFRGDDPIIIKDITADSGDYTFSATSNDGGKTWNITISNVAAKSSTTSIKINVKLSETSTRTKTFTIYHTQFDKETVSVDFGDDNVLVPCSDGNTPDEGFFTNFEIPVIMRVAGEIVEIKSITSDKNPECFETTSAGNIKVKDFPGTEQKTSVKFTISDGINSADGYVNFTKFNTAGGTLSMYTLNVDANDIVCDTRHNKNEYTVYAGKKGKSDNIIKVSINKYSSKEGNTVIPVSELTEKYRVYYANDPEDWSEDANSTLGEYQPITDAGIEIGKDINPDKCVSFQLREWVGQGTAWSDMEEGNYKVWDSENILVDIIRDIASYQFVITPNKIHRNVNGEIVIPENQEITIGLSKNIAGDGVADYEALSVIPTGYDIYYEKDNNGNPDPIGGESENVTLPFKLNVSDVINSIVFTLVVNENSEDDGMIVLSETVEITSDVPGKSAYIGYLTDSMCTVSCDANGVPTAGQVYDTTFKVTNGTVDNVTIPSGSGYEAEFKDGKVYFSGFGQGLPEVTKLTLTATCTYSDGTTGEEEAGYTIIKLKVAEASTILDFSNDNIVIPCDENGTPYTTEVSTFVAMLHGDDALTLESENVTLGNRDDEGYYKITLSVSDLTFNGDVCNKELTFIGTDTNGESWTRKGQLILTKMKAGESGKIWDLILTADSPKYNNDEDRFDDDYIEGWVNIWGASDWEIASYQTLKGAGRYIVYKPNEENEIYVPVKESDFVDNKFRIYINALPEGSEFSHVDIDRSEGAKIALAKLENGEYIPIQEEIINASFDGRDFSKFELLLSDSLINKTYKEGTINPETITPNEIKVLGVFEYNGPVRHDYTGGELHTEHVAGLDIYYSIDNFCSEFDASKMTPVTDSKNDGWLTNDTIPVDLENVDERLDVYLIAHYNEPGDNSNNTTPKIVDHKELKVVPFTLPGEVYLYHLELSQDEVKVPIDEKGIVDPDFTVSVIPYLYANDDVQDELREYVFGGDTQPASGWSEIKEIFNASDFSENHSYIWFRSEAHNLYKKCKITKEVNPVEIFIDRLVVKRDLSTNKVNDKITLEIKKWNYSSNIWESITGYNVSMRYTTVESSVEKSTSVLVQSNKYQIDLNNNSYSGINYIKFVISKDGVEVGTEEVGVITDGMDGSSREVIYYKSEIEGAPKNPTPSDWADNNNYQTDDSIPLDWTYPPADNVTDDFKNKWVDEYPGVNDSDCQFVYACERKRSRGANSIWEEFSTPYLYTRFAKDGTNGTPGTNGESTLVYDFTNNHIPVVPHMKDYGFGDGVGTEIHVYYGFDDLPLEAHNDDETNDDNKRIVVEYNGEVILADNGSFHWGFNEGAKTFSFGAGLVDWLMAKDAKAEYWKLDITVQVTVGDETKKLTKGLYLYKAESLRPKLSITPNVIKVGETEELIIQVFGADNQLVEKWFDNGYTIEIDGIKWEPMDKFETYSVGENPVSIVLYKDEKFADAETIPVLRDGVDGSIDEEQKQQIIDALIAEANENIETAKSELNGRIDTETQNLRNALFDGDTSAIAKATSALTLATNAEEAVTTLETLLKNASGADEGALDVSDLYNLSVAALGSKAGDIVGGGNNSYADAVWAQNLVALVGTFVDIKAENIGAGTISGNTLQSSEPISEEDDRPKWILENDGSGYLANDHIRWTKEGVLTIDGVPVVTVDEKNVATFTIDKTKVFAVYQDENNEQYINALLPFAAPSITAKVNTATSDMTLKDVVKDVELSVDELANAPTFVFDWKDGSGRSVGTSAQYWQDVLPEAVLKGGNDKLSLAYGNTALVGMISLARTVREQNEKIAKLESLVEELLNKLS